MLTLGEQAKVGFRFLRLEALLSFVGDFPGKQLR